MAVALELEDELPDVASPDVDPVCFFCDEELLVDPLCEELESDPELLDLLAAFPLLPLAEPEEAFALLPFVALPLPDMFWLAEPPLPPWAELLAGPELPEDAFAEPPPPPEYPVVLALALPVEPELALLEALPPLALPSWFWLAFPLACELLEAVLVLEEEQVPEVEVPLPLEPPPLFDELDVDDPDEHEEFGAARATWDSTSCTARKARAAVANETATLTIAFFTVFISPIS